MTEATIWVYITTREKSGVLYTVGFYDPNGNWHTDSDHDTRGPARDRVNYLNGGFGPGGNRTRKKD